MTTILKRFAADESGATVVEYALIVALIGIGLIVTLRNVGIQLGGIFTQVAAGFK